MGNWQEDKNLTSPNKERRPSMYSDVQQFGSMTNVVIKMGRHNKNQTGIKLEVINEIIELAKKFNIYKVILFGSRARGDFREKSDIDLAVV